MIRKEQMINKLDNWHKSSLGLLFFAAVELIIAYGLASLAINNGNLWYYLLTIILLVGALKNFTKLIGKIIHGGHKTSKA